MRQAVAITYTQLLSFGVHVGHSFNNSILYASWLVYTYIQNILIINLFKSIYLLQVGLQTIKGACFLRAPVWFVNLDGAMSLYVKHFSQLCGEFAWTDNWVYGLISNYISLYKVYRAASKATLKSQKTSRFWLSLHLNNFLHSRLTWPRAVFVSNVDKSYAPVKEALDAGVPCLGVVDTNVLATFISIPFPANDESIDCVVFYNNFISLIVLLEKYDLILRWYFSIRRKQRLSDFNDWWKKNNLKRRKLFNLNNKQNPLKRRPSYISLLKKSGSLFISMNAKFQINDGLLMVHEGAVANKHKVLYEALYNRAIYWYKFTTVNFLRLQWSNAYRYFAPHYLSQENFLLHNAKPYYYNMNYLTNRFYAFYHIKPKGSMRGQFAWKNLKIIILRKYLARGTGNVYLPVNKGFFINYYFTLITNVVNTKYKMTYSSLKDFDYYTHSNLLIAKNNPKNFNKFTRSKFFSILRYWKFKHAASSMWYMKRKLEKKYKLKLLKTGGRGAKFRTLNKKKNNRNFNNNRISNKKKNNLISEKKIQKYSRKEATKLSEDLITMALGYVIMKIKNFSLLQFYNLTKLPMILSRVTQVSNAYKLRYIKLILIYLLLRLNKSLDYVYTNGYQNTYLYIKETELVLHQLYNLRYLDFIYFSRNKYAVRYNISNDCLFIWN